MTTYRLLLDPSRPDTPRLAQLPEGWRDVTGEFPGLASADNDVQVIEFEKDASNMTAFRKNFDLEPTQAPGLLLLTGGDLPPWGPPVPSVVPAQADGGKGRAADAGGIAGAASVAPPTPAIELSLLMHLDHFKDEDARDYTKRLLDIRLGGRQAEAEAEAAARDVRRGQAAFEAERVPYLRATIEGVRERVAHMREWRRLAKWGVGFFVATTAFALWAAWYLITGPVNDGKMTGETFSLVLFVLALFAVSPATLLLLERPLRGLDSWSPDGKAQAEEREGEGGADDTAAAGEKQGNPAPRDSAKAAGDGAPAR